MTIRKVVVNVLMALSLILFLIVVLSGPVIFQRGNPFPYISKILGLDNKNHYFKVFDDADIFITKVGDYDELHKYIENTYMVEFYEQMGSSYIFTSENKKDVKAILDSEIYFRKYEVWELTVRE